MSVSRPHVRVGDAGRIGWMTDRRALLSDGSDNEKSAPGQNPLANPGPICSLFVRAPVRTLHVVDRLVTALMTLVEAVAPGAKRDPNLPEAAAQSLFFRLGQLVIHLIRISNFGISTRAKPKPTTQAPNPPAPAARPSLPPQPGLATFLPRRPGWLLAALPEIAPSVAADIGTLLADPAIAALLDRAPSLHRTLRPLLRSLGLDTAPPSPPRPHPPSPTTNPRGATPPNLAPASEQTDPPHPAKTRSPEHQTFPRPTHYEIVTRT